MSPRRYEAWPSYPCPRCDRADFLRRQLVWHLHIDHGLANDEIAALLNYQPQSISPLLSVERRRQS